MTGDKKDPTIDENLARIRELVESVKKPASPESPESKDNQDSGQLSRDEASQDGQQRASQSPPHTDAPHTDAPHTDAPHTDEGAAQNLARKGAVDSASRTPLTDYISENMPEYLDTPARQPSASPDAYVQNLPTADNGFNEPFVKASVSPLDDDAKPAPFVTGVSSQQIKPRTHTDAEDEIPQAVLNTLLQSGEKGKVHIRSGVNAPAFTSPHNVQISINRENRRTLEEIAKNPTKQATISESGDTFAQMQPKQVTPNPTEEPLVLTDVLVLDEVVPDDAVTGAEQPATTATNKPQTPPSSGAVDIPSDLRKPTPPTQSQPEPSLQAGDDNSMPEQSALVRIRTAMEHLKQTQIDREPFDSAVRDMVETEVRPYVKKWVNDNIADVVERQVDTQIQKILNKI